MYCVHNTAYLLYVRDSKKKQATEGKKRNPIRPPAHGGGGNRGDLDPLRARTWQFHLGGNGVRRNDKRSFFFFFLALSTAAVVDRCLMMKA